MAMDLEAGLFVPDRAERMAAIVADTPLRRFGAPDEVAALAVFLAADESAYITGSEFHVDGGLLAGTAATPAQASARQAPAA